MLRSFRESFKKNLPDQLRRKRFNENLKIHQIRRDKQWLGQRDLKKVDTENEIMENILDNIDMLDINSDYEGSTSIKKEWIKDLMDESVHRQWTITQKFAKLISKIPDPTIDDLIHLGLVKRFFELLKSSSNKEVPRIETNVSTVIVELSTKEIVPHLPEDAITIIESVLKKTKSFDTIENLIQTVSNIAFESTNLREEILSSSCWITIIEIAESSKNLEIYKVCSHLIFIVLDSLYNVPDFDKISKCFPIIKKMLTKTESNETKEILLKSILMICRNYSIKTVLDMNICDLLVGFLNYNVHHPNVICAALDVIGDILLGEDEDCQHLIDANVISNLHNIMFHPNVNIRNKVCNCIANLSSGPSEHIQILINENVYPDLLEILMTGSHSLKYEVAWTLRKSVSRSRTTEQQFRKLISFDFIEILCNSLLLINESTMKIVLNTIKAVMTYDYDEKIKEKVLRNISK
jgi:importin subunit alpha-6/7